MSIKDIKPNMQIKHTVTSFSNGVTYSSTRYGKVVKLDNELALVEIANYGEVVKQFIPISELQSV